MQIIYRVLLNKFHYGMDFEDNIRIHILCLNIFLKSGSKNKNFRIQVQEFPSAGIYKCNKTTTTKTTTKAEVLK